MKKLLLLLLLSIVFISVKAQSYLSMSQPEKWVKPENLDTVPEIDVNEISDGYLYVLRDYQYHADEETGYYHLKKKIYSETGVQTGAETNISFDPTFEKLIFHSFNIIREGKVVNKFSKKDIKVIQRETSKENHLYDGSLLAYIIPEDVRPGDEIEYSYSIKGRNPLHNGKYFDSWYLNFYDPSIKFHLKILTSASTNLNLRFINEAIAPVENVVGTVKTYTWNINNQKGLIMDTDCPSWYNPYSIVEISEYNTWEEIVEWALPLFEITKPTSSELEEEIRMIEQQYTAPDEKLVAALDFVQNKIRFTGIEAGIGAYKPMPPDQVLRQRFGDCKGKSLLLCVMLKELGIEAYPALVHTTNGKILNERLPSPEGFNHCVVVATIFGQQYWYDPTHSQEKGNFSFRHFNDYGWGLIIKEGETDLTRIKRGGKPQVTITEVFDVEEAGHSAILTVETKYIGAEADYQRYYFSNNKLEQISKNYLNFYASSYPGVESAETLSYQDDSLSNTFTTYEKYNILDFWTKPDSSSEQVEVEFYASLVKERIKSPSNSVRTMPLHIDFPLDVYQRTQINLPWPFNLENESKEIFAPGVVFNREINYSNNVLSLDYHFKTTKSFIEGSEAQKLAAKLNTILDELGYGLIHNPNYVPETEAGVNYLMVAIFILAIIGSSYFIYRLYHYDPLAEPVINERNGIGGWLILPAIGLLLSPFRLLYDMKDLEYFDQSMWNLLTDKESVSYNPFVAGALPIELIFNVFVFLFSIFLAIIFFQRRSSFPLLYQFYLVGMFIFLLGETIYIEIVQPDSATFEEYKEIGRSFIAVLIWVPYMRISKRVKETFTKRLKPEVAVPPPLPVQSIEENKDEPVF